MTQKPSERIEELLKFYVLEKKSVSFGTTSMEYENISSRPSTLPEALLAYLDEQWEEEQKKREELLKNIKPM